MIIKDSHAQSKRGRGQAAIRWMGAIRGIMNKSFKRLKTQIDIRIFLAITNYSCPTFSSSNNHKDIDYHNLTLFTILIN